jgi:hypothetical protein
MGDVFMNAKHISHRVSTVSSFASAILGAWACAGPAWAGVAQEPEVSAPFVGSAPVKPGAPLPSAHGGHRFVAPLAGESGFGAALNLTYHTDLYYRGRYQGPEASPSNIDIHLALGDDWTWASNLKWIDFADSDIFERSHLYTGLFTKIGSVVLGPSFKHYHFYGNGPARDNAYEFGLQAAAKFDQLTLGAGAFYETESEGTYLEWGASYQVALTDTLSLVPAVELSYADEWLVPLKGMNAASFLLSIPWKASNHLTVTPFISLNLPLEATESIYNEEFSGGVSVSWRF